MGCLPLIIPAPSSGQGPLDEENPPQPSIELLEFIGSFSLPEGEWTDPLELEDMDVERQELECEPDGIHGPKIGEKEDAH